MTTEPDTWIRDSEISSVLPYRKITGIEEIYLPRALAPNQSIWRGPSWFGTRLLSYWRQRAAGPLEPHDRLRNCVGFACHMAGIALSPVIGDGFHALDRIFKSSELSQPWDYWEPLPLGAVAILGNPVVGGVCYCGQCESHVLHAWVGLGTTEAQIIEVKAYGGNVSLDRPAESYYYHRWLFRPGRGRPAWASADLCVRMFCP